MMFQSELIGMYVDRALLWKIICLNEGRNKKFSRICLLQIIYRVSRRGERIRHMEKHVLTVHRNLTTPHLFQAHIFLNRNQRLWNEKLVIKAINCARSELAVDLLKSHDAYEMELGED